MKFSFAAAFTAFFLLLFPNSNYSQAPPLGATSDFAVFTAVGAFTNDGNTVVTGDIGTDVGLFTGFPPGIVIGDIHVADLVSAQAAIDVDIAYSFLDGLTCGLVLGTTLGNNQILTPDIYCTGAATVLNGILILDAAGDPDAIFIFQIDGALSTGTLASVMLINGASLCNVYWQVNGAFTLGEGSFFRGTVIANGAMHLLEGSSLEGRALTRAGAIDLHNNVITLGLPPVAAILTVDGPTTFCEGDSVTISGNIDGIFSNGELTTSITVMTSGDYFVTNTTLCGSDTSNHIIITVNPPPNCAITGDTSFCEGETVELCATGGSTFFWSTGETTACIMVGVAAAFSVTITDDNECTSSCQVTTSTSVAPDCTITGNLEICEGETTVLCAPAGAASYLWNSGETTECITVSADGIYSITVTDSNGCSSICSETVVVNPLPDCTITGTLAICDGQSTELCGPPGLFSYLWSTGETVDCITVGASGDYSLTVTDDNGCSAICTETVLIGTPPDCSISGDLLICEGETTEICAAGGGSSYLWDTGETTECITVSVGTTYFVTVTDASGCTSICSETVTVNPLPDCTITGNLFICEGQSTELCVEDGGFSFLWSTGEGTNCINVNASGDYDVTVTDSDGCTSICSATVIDSPPPSCTITGDLEICLGESTQLCTPPGALSYLWSTGETTNCITVDVEAAYSVTITFIGGCTTTCSVMVIVNQPEGCTITGDQDLCEGETSQLCATEGGLSYLWDTGETEDCIIVSAEGTYSVTVTDLNGCTSTCNATIMVNPIPDCTITGDSIICLGDSTILCSVPGAFSYNWSTGASTSCITVGSAGLFSLTVTDEAGCSSVCSINVSVGQGQLPVITCPADVSIECDEVTLPSNTGSATTTGGCTGDATVDYSDVIIDGTCAGESTIIRTWIATDAAGNTSVCTQTISISDNTIPTISCPEDVTIQCASEIPVPDLLSVLTSDNCDEAPVISLVGEIGTFQNCPNQYNIIRTYRSTDACGNFAECNHTITIFDDTIPMITCPADLTVQCASEVPAPDLLSIISTDNCGGIPVITLVGEQGAFQNCPNGFVITRTYRSTDACGNVAECNQTITVSDDTLPMISCPANITVQCGEDVPLPDLSVIISTDNCGGEPLVEFLGDIITSQSCNNRYTITRTYRSTDLCGNTADCDQTITVFDNALPLITCPVNITVQCAGNVPAPNPSAIISTDNCGGQPLITFVGDIITNQICNNKYTITRIYRSTDLCGNFAECNQTITVFDNTLPIITCPLPLTFQCAGQIPLPNPLGIVATDNCGGLPVVTFASDVISNQTCANRFTLTRTYRAIDACGNSATCAQIITVFDNIAPTISCPANVTVQCAGLIPPVNLALVTSDNCGSAVITIQSEIISNQTCGNRFTLTRTYRSTDACGNFSTCNQVITVFDNIAPTIVFQNPLLIPGGTFEVQCFGQDPEWEIPVFDEAEILATDNCGGEVTVTFNQVVLADGNCEEDGFITSLRLTWTATDICGNSSNVFVFMNLVDTIAPVIIGIPADITVNCDSIPEAPIMLSATDECLCACVILVEDSPLMPGCQHGQILVRTWTATDACGNQSIETQNITLVSEEGPALQLLQTQLSGITNGSLISYTCNEGGIPSFFDSLSIGSIVSAPGCGDAAQITFDSDILISTNCDFFGFVEQRVFRWEAIDACGNTSGMIITVQLIDDEEPVIHGVPSITCIGDPSLDIIEATDNCGSASVRFWDVIIPNPCGVGTAVRRTYEAFDDCGNMSRDTAMIIPDDQTQQIMQFVHPDMAALSPGDVLTLECHANGAHYTSFGPDDVFIENACSVGVEISFTERVITQADCRVDSTIGLMELKWTATDACGNSSELILLANIVDRSAPVLEHFSPVMTVGCHDLMPEIFASDNCGDVVITILESIVPGDCAYMYDVTRLITATDPCGNKTTATQIIHVGNGGGPVFTGIEEYEICDDLIVPLVTAFDACAEEFVDVTMVEDTLDMPCRDGLVISRTWTAVDICGNMSASTQTIIIHDQTPPEILIPSWSIIRKYMDQLGNQLFLSQTELLKLINELNEQSVFVTDECDQEIIPVLTVNTLFAEDCLEEGFFERRTYTWIATDICGNSDSIMFVIDILDDIPPVFEHIPADTTIVCVPLFDAPGLFAAESNVVYTQTIEQGGPGEFIVTRTWKATDACGNVTEIVQQIIWIPDTFLACDIVSPDVFECNSHGVIIGSVVTGGLGIITYDWEVVGEKCFIQGGQGTPEISIYTGFADVKIILNVTDAFGCVSMCMILLDCEFFLNPSFEITGQFEMPAYEVSWNKPAHLTDSTFNETNTLSQIQTWPNPVSRTLNLSFLSSAESMVELKMSNFLGQDVITERFHGQKGLNTRKINTDDMQTGTYLMQMTTMNKLYNQLIIVVITD